MNFQEFAKLLTSWMEKTDARIKAIGEQLDTVAGVADVGRCLSVSVGRSLLLSGNVLDENLIESVKVIIDMGIPCPPAEKELLAFIEAHERRDEPEGARLKLIICNKPKEKEIKA